MAKVTNGNISWGHPTRGPWLYHLGTTYRCIQSIYFSVSRKQTDLRTVARVIWTYRVFDEINKSCSKISERFEPGLL